MRGGSDHFGWIIVGVPLLSSLARSPIESPLADLMFRKLGVFAVVVGALAFLFRKAKSFIDNEDESGLSV